MRLGRTLERVAQWQLIALQARFVERLLRQHGRLLLRQEQLHDRLTMVERRLDQITDPSGDRLSAGAADAAPGIIYRTVQLKNGHCFEVAVNARLNDPISRAIAVGETWFLDDFYVLLERMRPGDRVLDLGGHVGTFALAAAALGCQVVCIEAAPGNVALLQASVARNGFDHMRVLHAAVSDHEGLLKFIPHGPWGTVANPAVTRVPRRINASNAVAVSVPAVTVDGLMRELGWERLDFIKLDVEGSEMAAIRGMRELLAQTAGPTMLYESNGHTLAFFGATPGLLTTTLHELGYNSYIVEPGRLVPVQPGGFQAECVVNCLAVKSSPPTLESWHITGPRSREELIAKIIIEALRSDEQHRAYIARALSEAEPSLVAEPRVTLLLRLLRRDAAPDVRAAAAWFSG